MAGLFFWVDHRFELDLRQPASVQEMSEKWAGASKENHLTSRFSRTCFFFLSQEPPLTGKLTVNTCKKTISRKKEMENNKKLSCSFGSLFFFLLPQCSQKQFWCSIKLSVVTAAPWPAAPAPIKGKQEKKKKATRYGNYSAGDTDENAALWVPQKHRHEQFMIIYPHHFYNHSLWYFSHMSSPFCVTT